MEQQVQGVMQRDDLPPPYSQTANRPAQFQIRRKPIDPNKVRVMSGNYSAVKNGGGGALRSSSSQAQNLEDRIRDLQATPSKARPEGVSVETRDNALPPPMPPRPPAPVITDGDLVASPQSASTLQSPGFPSNANIIADETTAEASTEAGGWKKIASEHAQKAFQEARHFMGGLIAHPSVSNKHYSILRHSHGVVFYQGSNTFLAISIFVDEPLPKDRTIWMQCKGWTGKTGMKAKALFGLNDSWINVTPTLAIQPDQVNASDERAWQRDIKRFRKKASGSLQERHLLRETAIVRVPVEATDGYYQLVLCRGEQKRKVLCNSPVFRVISTSSDPSTLRGASLSTLPVELGLWVGGLYVQSTASSAISPVTNKIQNSSLMPSGKTQFAMQTAYTVSGLEDRVDAGIEEAGDHYSETQNEIYTLIGPVEYNAESGPMAPYPLEFVAKLNVQGVASTFDAHGFPRKINVVGIPQTILPRLDGHYFAWCKTMPTESPKTPSFLVDKKSEALSNSWVQCIISASSVLFQERVSNLRSQRALRVTTSIKIIEDIDIPPSPAPTRIQIRIMGFIRPSKTNSSAIPAGGSEAEYEQQIVLDACDIELTRNTLDNLAWQPDPITAAQQPLPSTRSMNDPEKKEYGMWDRAKDGYSSMRLKSQTMVEQIPFHRVGIRTGVDELKDRNLAVDGYYIPR